MENITAVLPFTFCDNLISIFAIRGEILNRISKTLRRKMDGKMCYGEKILVENFKSEENGWAIILNVENSNLNAPSHP